MDLASIARLALGAIKHFAPLIPGGAAGVEAVESVHKLIEGVLPGADAPTRAELEQLRADVNARVDATINSLGDA